MEQALDFWTSLGRVGSPLVSSGPIVQALENLNTAAAQASDLVDERRIKNHIAGVQELQGIQRTHQGKLMIEGSSAMEVLELEQTAAGAADPYQKEQVEEELKLAQTALKQTTVEYNNQLEQEHKECFQALTVLLPAKQRQPRYCSCAVLTLPSNPSFRRQRLRWLSKS